MAIAFHNFSEVLSSIPTELDALYERIIKKRKPEHVLELYIISQIVLCSQVPVSPRSLMVITDVSLTGVVEENTSVSRMQQKLASRSGGLIEIYEETEDVCRDDVNTDDGDIDDMETDDTWRQTTHGDRRHMETDDTWTKQEEREYVNHIINDVLADSHNESGKVYSVQLLHQTAKFHLERPGNTKSLLKDSEHYSIENGWSYIL